MSKYLEGALARDFLNSAEESREEAKFFDTAPIAASWDYAESLVILKTALGHLEEALRNGQPSRAATANAAIKASAEALTVWLNIKLYSAENKRG